ncbi:MAG: hypothetical protein H7Y22_02880 [Gemmatimonadaceae bacterium]|nr:hypothetical protein [Gloeobacterales cyanobacterium ES-bin-141]
MNKDSALKDIDQFTGTEQWYCHRFGLLYTDGVRYVANHGAYWLIDAIASHQPTVQDEPIQFWKLTVQPDCSAVLLCERDTNEPLLSQEIDYTDFPVPEIRFYLADGVLMLPTEY